MRAEHVFTSDPDELDRLADTYHVPYGVARDMQGHEPDEMDCFTAVGPSSISGQPLEAERSRTPQEDRTQQSDRFHGRALVDAVIEGLIDPNDLFVRDDEGVVRVEGATTCACGYANCNCRKLE